MLGELSMKIEGALTFSSEAGRWNFDGTIRFFDDPYDFNMDMSRPRGSALTIGGMMYDGKGTPFDMEI